MPFLLDTNSWIHYLKHSDSPIRARLEGTVWHALASWACKVFASTQHAPHATQAGFIAATLDARSALAESGKRVVSAGGLAWGGEVRGLAGSKVGVGMLGGGDEGGDRNP